ADLERCERWQRRVQRWVGKEGAWLQRQLAALPGLQVMPSAANYLLIRGVGRDQPLSLQPLREALALRHRILVRDCRSFEGLDATWLRLGYQSRRDDQHLVRAIRQELSQDLSSINSSASS
ncbi:MAG: threonine-phosphate decarboxylase, partial [Vulcanococcus sp.]